MSALVEKVTALDISDDSIEFDAIIIGAGISGLNVLRKFRDELGLNTLLLEREPEVGGTWYVNRYPGCLSDSEAFVYQFSFDEELWKETKWNTRYLAQPMILEYLKRFADRYELKRNIQFNTAMSSAHFDEKAKVWRILTSRGDRFNAKFLVTAIGPLSVANVPDIKNISSFKGEVFHTSNWPHSVDLTGKRVGVIGTA